MRTDLFVPMDWRRPGAAQGFWLRWYPEQGFGEISPRPQPQELAGFYDIDDYYTHNSSSGGADLRLNWWGKVLRRVAWQSDRGVDTDLDWWRATLGNGGGSVVDIGSGGGKKLRQLMQLGFDAVGVEPDARAVSNSGDFGCRVYLGSAEELPAEIRGATFDAVIFSHVLEHCLDPDLAIANARAILRPGGICIAEVPNNMCFGLDYFGEAWFFLDVPRHLNFFTEDSLSAAFERHGFAVAETQYRGYMRHFDSEWREIQQHIARLMALKSQWRFGAPGYSLYLLRSAFAGRQRKYDSVRVICRAV